MDVMEIPARVISLWPWDQLGLDGREDNLRSLLDPDRLVFILYCILDLLDYVNTWPYI